MLKRLVRRGGQLVGLIVAGVLMALSIGFYAENRDNPLMPSGRWLGWIAPTIVLAVFVIRNYRRSWRRMSFWLTLLGLFAARTALYAAAFQAIAIWRGAWFAPLMIAEYFVFSLTLDWLGYDENGAAVDRRV